MAFDAKKKIEDTIVGIDDEIKQVLRERESATASFERRLKGLLEAKASWESVLAPEPVQPEPVKPAAAKKAAAKKAS